MGLFDALFGNRNQIPTVTTILPDAARQEIIAGRLPILNTDKLFLKRGEKIHFIDKAVNLEEKTVKQYRHYGHSSPGLFEGTRWSSGRGKTVEHTELVQHRGILYITNQRIVFQATKWGFDKTYRYLTAITPYSNACEMQFGNKSYCMIVADGSVVINSVPASAPVATASGTASGASVAASAPADDPFGPVNNGAPLVLDMSNIPNPDDFDEGAVW